MEFAALVNGSGKHVMYNVCLLSWYWTMLWGIRWVWKHIIVPFRRLIVFVRCFSDLSSPKSVCAKSWLTKTETSCHSDHPWCFTVFLFRLCLLTVVSQDPDHTFSVEKAPLISFCDLRLLGDADLTVVSDKWATLTLDWSTGSQKLNFVYSFHVT